MLIDDVTITVSAGNGGDGAVSFIRNKKEQGPDGGDGGNGGDVYFTGVSDLTALRQFQFVKTIEAEHGGKGGRSHCHGANGNDITIKLPVGTVIHNLDDDTDIEITEVDQTIMFAKGGRGGKGNYYFVSSTNRSPKEFYPGKSGQSFKIRLELKMIADIGLIGLPNVGKSSLLNEATNAQSKVANYHFTTLQPHLGVYKHLILADIPGLIKGASTGKGLGIKFLKHVERTKILFHLISADSKTPVKDYTTIRAELKKYNPELIKKPEYILISKSDLLNPKDLKALTAKLKKKNSKVSNFSIYDYDSFVKVCKILDTIKK
jgi:GTP-binding protein